MSGTATTCLTDWEYRLDEWLAPFVEQFRHKAQRRWAPVYLRGLLGPGARKSMEPIALRVAPSDVQQIHNFVSTSRWDPEPLQDVLVQQANAIAGGDEAHLIIDDTALVKKGKHSVGVAQQYCGVLGKNANCQSLVSLTLARREVPVAIGLRLFLPNSWTNDRKRCQRAGVPETEGYREKWRIALDELDRVIAAGVQFGDVLSDCGYGKCSEFRSGLTDRGLRWAVGILSTQNVYPANVRLITPRTKRTGRPAKHPIPSKKSVSAEQVIESLGPRAFRRVTWRRGTKGKLGAEFAIVRVCVADGPRVSERKRLPGQLAWLVCERRDKERKYYLCNFPENTSKRRVVAAIKARWSCEQAHQQLKQELGLDHFEGRSWNGLHHHALLTMMAFGFLQKLRCEEKKRPSTRAATYSFAAAS